jgi:hypothetical protein
MTLPIRAVIKRVHTKAMRKMINLQLLSVTRGLTGDLSDGRPATATAMLPFSDTAMATPF